jgi:hypothetical protein
MCATIVSTNWPFSVERDRFRVFRLWRADVMGHILGWAKLVHRSVRVAGTVVRNFALRDGTCRAMRRE